jgi:RNA polymerase sigma factor (TIGR02999 family)
MNINSSIQKNPQEVETWSSEIYQELRHMAARQMASQPSDHTLQATALVHEAWLRLGGSDQHWQNRAHFFGAAAQAMRQILTDQARRKAAAKNGGGHRRVELSESRIMRDRPEEEVLEVNDALDGLAARHPAKAQLVKLRYFVGLSLGEAAAVLGISEATAKRHWAYSRAWLYREIRERMRGKD